MMKAAKYLGLLFLVASSTSLIAQPAPADIATDEAVRRQAAVIMLRKILALVPEVQKQKINTATLVQDGKVLYEMGRMEDAEVKLKQAAAQDPDNIMAFYYLTLIEEARYSQGARLREISVKNKSVEVE